MKILAVIPARLASTRLPQKPLQKVLGRPLITYTYESVRKCHKLDRLIVATDHSSIAQVVTDLGGEALITPSDLPTGTDRTAYVAALYPEYDLVLNIQGDEPMVTEEMIQKLIEGLSQAPMSTLACPLDWEKEYESPHHVKVLLSQQGFAIYFSRSPIPYLRQGTKPIHGTYKHMGLYGFRREFLLGYKNLPKSSFEEAESLEQLRALQNGFPIVVGITQTRTIEVNLPEELMLLEAYFKNLSSG